MRPGEQIDDYTIVSKIGEGGMSVVYVAAHVTDGTRVVVKELKEEYQFDRQLVDRFIREADILQKLRHPHLARVFACLERDDKYYMVQEYLSGGSLADLLRDRKPYTEMEALVWCRDALRAMNYAHENGIVHRDLKPSNLMLDDRRRVRVIDFGIARTFGETRLTRAGDGSIGTVEYMSPEQILSPDKVDHLTDVYSMGIVLYELLSGTVPFDGDTPFAVQEKITRHSAPALRQFGRGVSPMNSNSAAIDPKLAKIVFRAIDKSPHRRFGGCAEFALHLDRRIKKPPLSLGRRAWEASRIGAAALYNRRLLLSGLTAAIMLVVVWQSWGFWVRMERVSASSAPGIRLFAEAHPPSNGVITYSYQVTNTGNVPLRNVNVIDDRTTPSFQGGDTDGNGELNVGETWQYEAVVTVPQSQLDAGGELVSQAVARADRVTSEPYRTIVRFERRPLIEISSLVNGAKAAYLSGPGPVTYTYQVKNTGNVSLTGVKVSDRDTIAPSFQGGDLNRNKILDVGETWQYQATARITRQQLDASSVFMNHAIAASDQGSSQESSVIVTMAPPMPVRVGGNVAPPQKIYDVPPQYPAVAQSAGIKGVVLLELTIAADGHVQDARVTRSVPALDQAALDAARQWRYRPTIVDGVATPIITTVAVQFTLVPAAPEPAGTAGPSPQSAGTQSPPAHPAGTQSSGVPPAAAPVRVGGSVKQPMRIAYVPPEYPVAASSTNVQGIVILEVTLNVKGQVQDVRVLRSVPLLDQAAVDAVRQWQYAPTVIDGVPVPVIMTETVRFELRPAPQGE